MEKKVANFPDQPKENNEGNKEYKWKLLDENYIKTKPGKEMARPLMQEMKNFIEMQKRFFAKHLFMKK